MINDLLKLVEQVIVILFCFLLGFNSNENFIFFFCCTEQYLSSLKTANYLHCHITFRDFEIHQLKFRLCPSLLGISLLTTLPSHQVNLSL